VYVVYKQREQLSGYKLDLKVKNRLEFTPSSLTGSLIASLSDCRSRPDVSCVRDITKTVLSSIDPLTGQVGSRYSSQTRISFNGGLSYDDNFLISQLIGDHPV
jgi:hypothetical protein